MEGWGWGGESGDHAWRSYQIPRQVGAETAAGSRGACGARGLWATRPPCIPAPGRRDRWGL